MKELLVIALGVCVLAGAKAEQLNVPTPSFPTIQDAIDSAQPGDIVVVNQGTYYENINFRGKAITVRSSEPNDKDIVANTILDGSQPHDAHNASVVTFNSREDNRSILEGFTIRGGSGSWILVSWEFQGIYWNRCGGGILCYNLSAPTIRNNVITGNTAGQGGGLYVYGDPVNPADPEDPTYRTSPIVADNTFTDNSARRNHGFAPPGTNYPGNDHGDGGALVMFQGCDAIITGNTFHRNRADFYGGAIHIRQWSHGLIEKNRIISNNSALGAGIHVTYDSAPAIRDNLIKANTAGSLGGAGVFIYFRSHPLVERNLITENSCSTGAGIAVQFSSNPTIRNNYITANINGAAIEAAGSAPLIRHNTITHNLCTSVKGAVQAIGTSTLVVENNIVADNTDCYGIHISQTSSATIRYNDFWNNESGNYPATLGDMTGIDGNISADPGLIGDSALLDYTSLCINAADPNFTPGDSERDYQGRPRFLNDRTDIGADEVIPVWNLTKHRQYTTIQAAIDDAGHGDALVATPGRYTENIHFHGKSIQLTSAVPESSYHRNNTIIDGGRRSKPVVEFAGVETAATVLAGLTITNADHAGPGGGIKGNGSQATVRRCNVTGNLAEQGGGLWDCDGVITHCIIADNESIAAGAGVYGCDGQLSNCLIVDNTAGTSGGGLNACNAQITGCTIASNHAALNGGALAHCGGQITNCIVWANVAPTASGLYDSTVPTYTCLQDIIPGTGNIFDNPQFIDPVANEYHITIYSPCIDAGDNAQSPDPPREDIDHEPRRFGDRIDIGADEVIWRPSDFDSDGTVGCLDLGMLANEWLTEGRRLLTDLTEDGLINVHDFALFAHNWGWLAPWHSDAFQSALRFDSSTDGHVFVETPQGCVLNNLHTYTWTVWIYPLAFDKGNRRIIGKNERTLMISYGGTIRAYSNGGGIPNSASAVGTLDVGRWQFVVMTYDYYGDGLIHLYADGREVDYQIQSIGSIYRPPLVDWRAPGEWDLMIGSLAWTPGTYTPDAKIGEVGIYNRILNSDEMRLLYNDGKGRPAPLSMNPIGLWRLNEGLGDTVIDYSPFANHGRLAGESKPAWTTGKFLSYPGHTQ